MLRIVGPPVQRVRYTRLPMYDGIGPVTAVIRSHRIVYRPTGGSAEERRVRAMYLAEALGGTVEHRPNKGFKVHVPFN